MCIYVFVYVYVSQLVSSQVASSVVDRFFSRGLLGAGDGVNATWAAFRTRKQSEEWSDASYVSLYVLLYVSVFARM